MRLFLSSFYFNSPIFLAFTFFSLLSDQGKGVSKSVSLNCGPCLDLPVGLKGLSHSDSYTWAVENRRSFQKDGSNSSLGSQELSFSDIYLDNLAHKESHVCKNTHNIGKQVLFLTGTNLFLTPCDSKPPNNFFSALYHPKCHILHSSIIPLTSKVMLGCLII